MEKDYILGLYLDHTHKLYAFTCRSLNRNKNWKFVKHSDSIVYEHDEKLFTVLFNGTRQECTALQPMFDMVYKANGYTPTLVKPNN